MQNNKILWIGAVIVIIFIAFVVLNGKGGGVRSPELDTFASCLKDKGVIFYGAFWCQHCANQKALFGKSVDKLPYVECSTPDSQGQLQVCKDASVTSYPTWVFPAMNGATSSSRLTGEIPLSQLAEKSGCVAPTIVK